jgi:hypothetical protein
MVSCFPERRSGLSLEVERLELQLFTGTQNTSSSTSLLFTCDADPGESPGPAFSDESRERIFLYILCVPPISKR